MMICNNKDTDRISNLPDEIIENILLRLSLRDSIRTSVLSHQWRYQWATLPQLEFDSEDLVPIPNTTTSTNIVQEDDLTPIRNTTTTDIGQEDLDNKIVTMVDQVLLLHRGPVRRFKLSTAPLERDADIDRWILFLLRNGIKELMLYKRRGERYKVPSSLFSCENITRLTLSQCIVIAPPASFGGFGRLKILNLESVTISSQGLEFMISRCPMMKKLILKHVDGCDHLSICAKKLVYLKIKDTCKDVCLKSCPLLATAYISLSKDHHELEDGGDVCKLVDVFASLPKIEKLTLRDGSLKVFTSCNYVPPSLPPPCQLKCLAVDLNFGDMQEMLGAFSIFRSTPVLQKLEIKAFYHRSTSILSSKGFWGAQENFNFLFSQLRVIEITNFEWIRSELKLIEFVLANAPVLELMGIGLQCSTENVIFILRKMNRYRRVSPKAEVKFHIPQIDTKSKS